MRRDRHKPPFLKRPLTVAAAISCLLIFVVVIRLWTIDIGPYDAVVFGGPDSLTVSVIDHEDDVIRTVIFEGEIDIPVAFEYGNYPISSLFKLDHMDRHDGALAKETASLLAGVPVTMAVSPPDGSQESGGDRIWSPESYGLGAYLGAQGELVSLRVLKRSFWVWRGLHLYRKEEPVVFTGSDFRDGTSDMQKIIDTRIGRKLVLSWVIRESLTVKVTNVSGISGEGARIGRMLSRIGFAVTSIDSSDRHSDERCLMVLGESAKDSKAVSFMSRVLSCRTVSSAEPMTADVEVLIGKR